MIYVYEVLRYSYLVKALLSVRVHCSTDRMQEDMHIVYACHPRLSHCVRAVASTPVRGELWLRKAHSLYVLPLFEVC